MCFNCFHIFCFVLFYTQELLSEQNIPSIVISASRKPLFVRNQLLQKLQPMLTNRESLFQICQPISSTLAQRLLLFSYKLHSAFGCLDPIKVIFINIYEMRHYICVINTSSRRCPILFYYLLQQYEERDLIQPMQWPLTTSQPVIFNQYIYFFESEENRNMFMLNPLKYLRQPKPFPSLPVKVAIVGPPKSGKTTRKTHNSCKIIENAHLSLFSFIFGLHSSLISLQWHRYLLRSTAWRGCPLAELCVWCLKLRRTQIWLSS